MYLHATERSPSRLNVLSTWEANPGGLDFAANLGSRRKDRERVTREKGGRGRMKGIRRRQEQKGSTVSE